MSLLEYSSGSNYFNGGLLEVMGETDCGQLPRTSHSLIQRINGCKETFGEQWTRGMLIRGGRASLYYWMRENTDKHGWSSPEFRLLSFRRKVDRGMRDLTNWWNNENGRVFHVESKNNKITIEYREGQPSLTRSDCAFFLGLFQEFVSWAGSGRFYQAVETKCATENKSGHTFEISLIPLD